MKTAAQNDYSIFKPVMPIPFNNSAALALRQCLGADGTFATSKEGSATHHEMLSHLQNYGAHELALAMGIIQFNHSHDLKEWWAMDRRDMADYENGLRALGVRDDRVDCDGKTALHNAIAMGRAKVGLTPCTLSIVFKLLKAGVDPDILDHEGNAALKMAAQLDFLSIVRSLRRAGATVAGYEQEFDIALTEELESSRDAVRIFIELGGDLEAPEGGFMPKDRELGEFELGLSHAEHDSHTSWINAARRGDLPLLIALQEAGANINAWHYNEHDGYRTAIGLAAQQMRPEVLRHLLKWGVPVEADDRNSNSALYDCINNRFSNNFGIYHSVIELVPKQMNDLVECVAILLEAGKLPSDDMFVLMCRDLQLLEQLWSCFPLLQPDVASLALYKVCSTSHGVTPTRRRTDFARALLEWGADPNYNEGHCLFLAQSREDDELAALLTAAGATFDAAAQKKRWKDEDEYAI